MKNFWIFTAGVAVGVFGVGYYLNKTYKENYEYEIELLHDICDKTLKVNNTKINEEVSWKIEEKPSIDELINEVNDYEETIDDILEDEPELRNVFEDYSQSIQTQDDFIEDIDEEGNISMIEKHFDINNAYPDPYEIDLDDFLSLSEYDSQTLTYYNVNDIVVDDAYGEIMPEAFDDSVIGRDILEDIKHRSRNKESEVYYIRNERLQMDYELIVSEEDYEKYIFSDEGE